MAEDMNKEAKKAALDAEKAAKKAKQERIKASKPKKEGNVFTRAWAAIVKFFKDFKGLAKKIVWPDAKTVFKSSGVVLVCVIVAGAAVYGVDQLLNLLFTQASNLSVSLGESFIEEPATEYVTDEDGNYVYEDVTDENGAVVTDENGENQTQIATQIVEETEASEAEEEAEETVEEEVAEDASEEETEEAVEESTEETAAETDAETEAEAEEETAA